MNIIDKIILIHPTKCAGTTISKKLFKLKEFSDNASAFYSGYSFNHFFQKNIRFFHSIFHSKKLIGYISCLLFYCVCSYFILRNFFNSNKYGLTFKKGSIQHFTYKQWNEINKIKKDSICISVVTHPQHRIASSFYFLGYDKHYTFLEFVQKIQDGSLLSSIPFLGFRAIIKQHLISMHDSLADDNGKINIDFIFKRESLNDDWQTFCKKYNLKHTPLEHINKTKKIANWKDLYKTYPEASQIIYDLYKKDFEHFEYPRITFNT